MWVANIRQWQWMLLALLIGAGIGLVRQWEMADLEGHFGEPINTQARFENALTRIVAGRPCFDDVRVYAASVPDRKGGTKRAYVVAGDYFNGKFEQSAGKLTAVWHPAFFIADVPYRPATNLDSLGRPALASQFRAKTNPTVLDFLEVLSAAKQIHYTHELWPDLGIVGWMACSFVLIGVIWPTTINLLVFGSIRRPPEPKGIDLSKVKPPAAPKPAPVVEPDLSVLAQLEAALEGQPKSEPQTAPVSAPAPVAVLSGGPAEPRPAATPQEHAEFAAAKEDYYPTARGTARKPIRSQDADR